MLTENDLQELLDVQAEHPVLSVYINTDPTEGGAEASKLRLRSMLKTIDLKDDISAVERFFDHEYDGTGRSLAMFSCAPEGFFKAFPLAVPTRSRVRINQRPYVKPLADILDAYGGYGVALVDKQGARFFYFHMGDLIEQEGTMGETVRRTKRGGSSQFHGRRGGVAGQTGYAEEVTDRNMRDAVSFAERFFRDKNVRRIIIAGTEDNVSQFRSLLPKAWQSLVVGSFPISMTASKDEVLIRALKIGQEAEMRREARLVEAVLTAAAKGHGAVIGLEDTLGALNDGRIQTLLIRDGYRAPGYRCVGCGHLTSKEMENCPFCGKGFKDISDAVELAVHEVMKLGGDVEVLHGDNIHREFRYIGALLRY